MSEPSEPLEVRIHARQVGGLVVKVAPQCWVKIDFAGAEFDKDATYKTPRDAQSGKATILVPKRAGYHSAQVLPPDAEDFIAIRIEVVKPPKDVAHKDDAQGDRALQIEDVAVADRMIRVD